MSPILRLFVLSAVIGLGACDGEPSGAVMDKPPPRVSEDLIYVFFLTEPGTPPSEAAALAEQGFQVIAPTLPADADLDFAAVAVKEWMRELLARGVRMNRLALVGRGEGGVLAMMVSGLAQVPASSLVVMAACPADGADGSVGWSEAYARMLRLHATTIKGRFLSLVDAGSPGTGSCRAVQAAANGAESWETELSSGSDWTAEAARWVREE